MLERDAKVVPISEGLRIRAKRRAANLLFNAERNQGTRCTICGTMDRVTNPITNGVCLFCAERSQDNW